MSFDFQIGSFMLTLGVAIILKNTMLRLKQHPYHLLLLTALILFIAGLFAFNSAIDIHIKDTFLIVPLNYFIWAPAVLLFTFWLIYLATKKFLFSKTLIWTHILLTILVCIFILAVPYLIKHSYDGLAGMPRRYYDIGQSRMFEFNGRLTGTTDFIVFVLIIGQLTYFVNFFLGLYKRG